MNPEGCAEVIKGDTLADVVNEFVVVTVVVGGGLSDEGDGTTELDVKAVGCMNMFRFKVLSRLLLRLPEVWMVLTAEEEEDMEGKDDARSMDSVCESS
jgi:hypothetical protein